MVKAPFELTEFARKRNRCIQLMGVGVATRKDGVICRWVGKVMK